RFMQVLLVHPDDHPLAGPWADQKWDGVFDLARSGWVACERWSQALRCPLKPIDSLRDRSRMDRVRELLQWGIGRLVDEHGLDWWELTSILLHQYLETLVLLWKFVDHLPPDARVFISRDGFEAHALRSLIGSRLHVCEARSGTDRKGLWHYADRLRRLPKAQ